LPNSRVKKKELQADHLFALIAEPIMTKCMVLVFQLFLQNRAQPHEDILAGLGTSLPPQVGAKCLAAVVLDIQDRALPLMYNENFQSISASPFLQAIINRFASNLVFETL